MSYYVHQTASDFFMDAALQGNAWNRIISAFRNGFRAAYVDENEVMRQGSFDSVMRELGFSVDYNLDQNAFVNLRILSDKLGEEDEVLDLIAPCVREGSYLELCGEDGSRFRWVFRNGKVITVEVGTPDWNALETKEVLAAKEKPDNNGMRGFYIDTPLGKLHVYAKTETDEANNFPGVYVDLVRDGYDDEMMTVVEYESCDKKLQTVIYQPGADEPADIFEYEVVDWKDEDDA